MFDMDPALPLWIVRKSGNIVVWPRGGLLSGPLVVVGAVYELRDTEEWTPHILQQLQRVQLAPPHPSEHQPTPGRVPVLRHSVSLLKRFWLPITKRTTSSQGNQLRMWERPALT